MNQIGKLILAFVLLAVVSGVNLRAETTAASPVAKAIEEAAAPLVTGYAPTLFKIGPVEITNAMVYAWVVAAVIIVFVRVGTRKLSADSVPTSAGNLIEGLVEGWESLINMILEPKVTRWEIGRAHV